MPQPSHMASMPQPSQRLPCGVKKRQTRRRQIKAGLDRSSAPPHVHNHEERKPSHWQDRAPVGGMTGRSRDPARSLSTRRIPLFAELPDLPKDDKAHPESHQERRKRVGRTTTCLLYTSDAADE